MGQGLRAGPLWGSVAVPPAPATTETGDMTTETTAPPPAGRYKAASGGGRRSASVGRGTRRRNGVTPAATAYVTQPPASHAVPDARGARCGMRNPKVTAISVTVTTSMATSWALVKRWAARRRSRGRSRSAPAAGAGLVLTVAAGSGSRHTPGGGSRGAAAGVVRLPRAPPVHRRGGARASLQSQDVSR